MTSATPIGATAESPVDYTIAVLAGNLMTLDSTRAIAVAAAVAAHRLTLPDDVAAKILNVMRGKLRETAPPRRIDPKRLFCVPFEDLLTNEDARTKTEGKISRAAIRSAWILVSNELGEATLRDMRTDTAHITVNDLSEADSMGDRWWPRLGQALSQVVEKLSSDRRYRAETAELLDAPTRPADLREMLDVLEAWEEVKALQSIVQRGTPHLNDDQVSAACAVIVDGDRAGRRSDRLMDIALARIGSSSMRQRFAKAVAKGGIKEADARAIEHAAAMATQGIEAAIFSGSANENIDIILDMMGRAKALTTHTDHRMKALQMRFSIAVKEHLAAAEKLDVDPMKAARKLDADHTRLKALMAVRNNPNIDSPTKQIAIDALNARKDELEAMLERLRSSGSTSSIAYFATLRTIETVWGQQKIDEILARDGLKASEDSTQLGFNADKKVAGASKA
jgi:hypothetical protein